jgi:hypothetical protein
MACNGLARYARQLCFWYGKSIRTKNTVMNKSNNGLALSLSNCASLQPTGGAVQAA